MHLGPTGPTLDTPLHIEAAGAEAGAFVTLTASQLDDGGRTWRASAVFVADDDGRVDVTSDAPFSGSYETIDPMGLVWSMTRTDDRPQGRPLSPLAPVTLRVTASVAAGIPVHASIERARQPDGIVREPITAPGVVGVLFRPANDGPWPGVVLLGGSEGGLHELDAALLAGHGFSVLALAYFGAPGLPDALVELPLETFVTAMGLLVAHPQVRGDRVGLLGGSRGGEAALLVAALAPGLVAAVVSVVGSGIVTAGIPHDPDLATMLSTDRASWTWRGRALRHLPYVPGVALRDPGEIDAPLALRDAFRPDLASANDIAAASIPVERIEGPVLLLSSEDDRMWPSTPLSEIAARRLARAGRFPFQHVQYPRAGHGIVPPPFGPVTRIVPGPGVRFDLGGEPAATSDARADAWSRTVAWFAEHLPA